MVFINIIFEEKRLIIALSYVRRTKSLFLFLEHPSSCFGVLLFCTIRAQKMKFTIRDFLRGFLRSWSQLLKKSVMGNFIFCVVYIVKDAQLNYGFNLISSS